MNDSCDYKRLEQAHEAAGVHMMQTSPRADELIACLEGEIAKRDEELAACRVAVENCEMFRARIVELESAAESLRLSRDYHHDQEIEYRRRWAGIYAAPVSEAKAHNRCLDEVARLNASHVQRVSVPASAFASRAITHYEAALLAAFPSGSSGEVFNQWNEARRVLAAAPSPAGVDGLGNTAKLLLPALRQYMHNDGSGLLAGYDLETTQAIIDGLRGEVAELQSMITNLSRAGIRMRTERDQLAQRLGEFEGLLRDSAELIKHGVFEDGYCCCGSSVDSHGLGDGHSPVDALAYHAGQVCERIDAALSTSGAPK